MPWARLDDDFHDNGKILSLSHQAFRLYVCAITYCRRHRSLGALTTEQAAALCRQQRVASRAVAELVAARAWEETPVGFRVHDFEQYQPREDETAAERMRRFRERRKASHSHGVTASPVTHSNGTVTRNGDAPVPIPNHVTTSGKPEVGDVPSLALPGTVPKPSGSAVELTAHQALFEAVAVRFGSPANDAERGKYAKAVKLLRQAGATPEEVAVLAAALEERWPNAECTPLSIANNVTTLRGGAKAPRREPRRESPMDQARRIAAARRGMTA